MAQDIVNPFEVAADIIDPPEWEPPDRPPPEPHQVPPPGIAGKDWKLWLLEAGRGSGKTEACARYFAKYMRANPGHRGRIIAPTYDDAVDACVNGVSGLRSVDPECKFIVRPGGSFVRWPNGSEARVLGTHSPKDVDRLRAGGNRHIDWWEEMAANAQLQNAWDQAAFGLRLGETPHSIASTTPRNTTAYKAIRKMADTVLINGISIRDNPHLSEAWRETMLAKYRGTRVGRQELEGELLTDVEGALWSVHKIEAAHVLNQRQWVDMARVIVAVDPAATSSPEADDTGIIVVGIGVDGNGWVIDDRTCHLEPEGWGQRAVRAYRKHKADLIVGEVNNGGEMVEHVIRTIDPRVPFKAVHASRGKAIRAQPVAALYGEPPKRPGIIRHQDVFPELEDQLTTWVPGEEDSPDRLDALVWGLTELFLEAQETVEIIEDYEPVTIGADL